MGPQILNSQVQIIYRVAMCHLEFQRTPQIPYMDTSPRSGPTTEESDHDIESLELLELHYLAEKLPVEAYLRNVKGGDEECHQHNDQRLLIRVWNRFLETGSVGRRPGQGRRGATMPNEDRYLVLTAQRHRNMKATLLQQHLRSATGTTVSTQTV
ncbi:transposable element Tcb2 transposase [Trichonephila clavipes]|uniref:Transposable element Tcb2 transposase n=1 Tax=Trichonephila clavipes TaxID=2585209 RepID=A0A8X6VZP8_TRICX|nr:transposable element Tcb2 transposase [Trichonephila clavipes]